MNESGEQRPWRRERKRVGPDRERPYRELGSYLAQLRQSCGISQQELAEKSLLTKHPFDRTYIARIENGEAADTAAKFLTYIALLQAKPETVVEIIEVAHRQEGIAEDLPIDEYLARCKSAVASGDYNQAVMWALAGLSRAAEMKDETWRAKFQISAAIVFKDQRSYSIARRFAEDALNNTVIDESLRARAAILAAGACVHANQPFSAKGLLRAINPASLDADLQLKADFLLQLANAEEATGDTSHAIALSAQARTLYEGVGSTENMARAEMFISLMNLRVGELELARQQSESAVQLSRAASQKLILGRSLAIHGRAQTLLNELTAARESLLEAERRATECTNETLLFDVRAYLMDLARRMKDWKLAHVMRRHLLVGKRSLRLPIESIRLGDELLDALSQEGNQ